MLKQYETVFILTPVLSETQMKEAVAKFRDLIVDNQGEIVYEEDWGSGNWPTPSRKKPQVFII
jgi:small subunit ribosomal protein S6